MKTICILGLGLMGGSLLKALRASGKDYRLVGWSHTMNVRERCKELQLCDAVKDEIGEAVAGADFIVLCCPVDIMVSLMGTALDHLSPNAVITDVGSTKASVCQGMAQILPKQVSFIGSHPMAGSEKTGLENAKEDLFKGKTCFVTPCPKSSNKHIVAEVKAFWEGLGMKTAEVTPVVHDKIVAHISHLPHMLSSVLGDFLNHQDTSWSQFSGPGLRDTLRIAGGDPKLWQGIAIDNKEELILALQGYESRLKFLIQALKNDEEGELHSLLASGQAYQKLIKKD